MKAILVLLLALLTFSAAQKLTDGRYRFTSAVSFAPATEPSISVSASALIFAAYSEDPAALQWYTLFLDELMVNGQPGPVSSLPFQFSRLASGQIGAVRVHPDETLELANLKKGIAETFQTSLTPRHSAHEVPELGAEGLRNVRYEVVFADSHKIDIKGSYRSGDFAAFAKNSNMEVFPFEMEASKVATIRPAGKVFESSVATSKVVYHQDSQRMEVSTLTRMEFESDEFAMIDVVIEADWIEQTLMHEIDVSSRVSNLKARMPALDTLFFAVLNNKLSGKELLLARGQIVTLMNMDQESLSTGLDLIVANLKEASKEQLAFLYSTLARVNAAAAQRILAAEISAAHDNERLLLALKSLASLVQPEEPATLMNAVMKARGSYKVNALVELTVGNLLKFLPATEVEEVIAFFSKLLQQATTNADKIHYLHVLGNAGQNAPIDLILSFLSDDAVEVRAAVLTNVRYHIHLTRIQDVIKVVMAQNRNHKVRSMASSLIEAMKWNINANEISKEFLDHLATLPQMDPALLNELQNIAAQKKPIARRNAGTQSETSVWDSNVDPNYNLVAPLAQRQEDVARYSDYTAYLFSNQYGPNIANLKIAGGVFSGHGGDACLAGDFKIFDKLYTETHVLRETHPLADLQLYVLTYENEFESRIYAIVNGNTIIDISISSNCSAADYPIFSGAIEVIAWETEIPISIGNIVIHAYAVVGLELYGGYEICLLTLNPFVELWVTGDIDLTVDAGVTVTAVGIIRGGLEGDVYVNYAVGPDTQLGSIVNNTSGEHVCKACIGIYYGYEDQSAYVGLFIQRREGLGWGEPTQIPLDEWVEPGVPFPTPLVEVCSDEEISDFDFHVLNL